MINRHFRTTASLDMVYYIEDLSSLQCAGDKDLHNYRHRWNTITANMVDKLQDKSLEHMMAQKLAKVPCMAEDLAHYHRVSDESEDKSYAYLRKAIDRVLDMRLRQQNREDQMKTLANQQKQQQQQQQQQTPAAPAAGKGNKKKDQPKGDSKGAGGGTSAAGSAPPPTKDGKGKGKGKDKSQDKGQIPPMAARPPCYFF
ncbi:MAG: hypothetical protein GY772_21855, partial [bacterium]|nr:hypothetical protein [bacterium]